MFLGSQTMPRGQPITRRHCPNSARRSVDDLGWFMRMLGYQMSGTLMTEGLETIRERDRRMGDNLVWMVNEYYAGRRVAVWAACAGAGLSLLLTAGSLRGLFESTGALFAFTHLAGVLGFAALAAAPPLRPRHQIPLHRNRLPHQPTSQLLRIPSPKHIFFPFTHLSNLVQSP